jgi:methanogenic corrinoid protein MtbC1
MSQEILVERFFETLICGDRDGSRKIVAEAVAQGATPEQILTRLFWPSYELVEKLHRADQLTNLSYHFSTRLLRVLIDQTSSQLERPAKGSHRIFACCGPSESEELGAQMAVDILEAGGYQVTFAGGGIAADEILAEVHESKPDVLLLFAAAASDLPGIRRIIDTIREISAHPKLKICVGAGVFNRAEGLAEEIRADLYAAHPLHLLEVLGDHFSTHQFPLKAATHSAAAKPAASKAPIKRRLAA